MSKFDSPLNNVRIASPCQADWDGMYGDDRKRFCAECKLSVYNLSGMTRVEAENLIQNAEGRLCVRLFQRRDGTVLTADCPVGWAKVKQRTRLVATAAFSMLMALFTGVIFASIFSKQKGTIGPFGIPFATPTPEPMMGAIAVRPISNNAVMGDVLPRSNSNSNDGPKAVMGKMAVRPVKAGDQFLTK